MRKFLYVFMAAITFQACSLDENTVAKVGDFKVTKNEFKAYLANRYGEKETYKSISTADKKLMLEHLILRLRKLNEAYKMGLDDDEEIRNEYAARKRQMLANVYYEKKIVDEIATDSLVQAEFEKTRYEVNASHVLISFAGAQRSMNMRSKEEAYTLAKTISYKVRSGSNINAMAMEYSDDKTKMDNKGNLGYFVWGKMVDEFQQAAYNLEKNEVSEPVLSPFGYHVIYLHDKRENPSFDMASLEKEKEEIKRRIYQQNRETARPKWDRLLEDLKAEYDFDILGHNIKEFVNANIGLTFSDTLNSQTALDKNGAFTLAEWEGGTCLSKELLQSYLKRYNNNLERFKSSLLDSLVIDRDTGQLASHMFVAWVSEKEGYLTEEIEKDLDNFLEFSLLKLVEKQSVNDNVDISDQEMKEFYTKNVSEFTIPEKMEMWEIYVTDEKKADQIYNFAKGGRNFEQLAKLFSEDQNYAKNYGRLGFRTETSRGQVSRKAFEAGPNQVLEPFQHRKGWLIVKTGDIKEKIVRSYEESQRQVAAKIKTKKSKELRENWETYLSEAYPAELNMDILPTI